MDIAVDPAVQDPNLVMKLSKEHGDIMFSLEADKEGLKVATPLSDKKVSDSKKALTGVTGFRLVLEAQSTRLFVDFVGLNTASILLPYSGNFMNLSDETSAWNKVGTIDRVYFGGHGVSFSNLSAPVLVF